MHQLFDLIGDHGHDVMRRSRRKQGGTGRSSRIRQRKSLKKHFTGVELHKHFQAVPLPETRSRE
jgi:hypothetical protein